MYLSLFDVSNEDYQGILSIDPQGNVSQFYAGGYWGNHIAFDTTAGSDFDGDLFIGGGSGLNRLTPAGEKIDFLTSNSFIRDFAFDVDGSLYVMEVDTLTGPVTISKITILPEPASLLLLGFGALTACSHHRKKIRG